MDFSNPDLAPVPQAERTWSTINYFSLWVGMAVCIPSYMIAASLITAGLSLGQAMLCVLLGNCIVLIPMLLNGMVGAKYGIPYPVFARASFGILGSNIPALLRAIVACGWFGIQTWIGGTAITTLIAMLWPGYLLLPAIFPEFMGVTTYGFLSFMIFWCLHLIPILKGSDSIKWLETAAAPLLLLSGLALLCWAILAVAGDRSFFTGVQTLFATTKTPHEDINFWKVFIPGLTGIVGFWATMSLNIPDFTRYAKNQKSQLIGQALGLPTTMTLFACIGVLVTRATEILYGVPIWDPILVVGKFENPIILFVSMLMIALATLSTNVAANVVGPANDFSNLYPARINFKMGGLITATIGILMMPWKLIADPQGYIFTWLIGYSSLLGPIGGILLIDYFWLRRQTLDIDELYQLKGSYTYRRGFNLSACAAFVLGVLPNVPGFLLQIKAVEFIPPMFEAIYSFAWFIGLALAAVCYGIFMRLPLKANDITKPPKIRI